jgi:hypothetical protein
MTEGIKDIEAKLTELSGVHMHRGQILEYVIEAAHRGATFLDRYRHECVMRDPTIPPFQNPELIQNLLNTIANWGKGWISGAREFMVHGIWDHFKGGVYVSTSTVRWAEDGEPVIIYTSLLHGTHHARRCSEWNELVEWPDGAYRSRFVFRGKTMTQPPSFKVHVRADVWNEKAL